MRHQLQRRAPQSVVLVHNSGGPMPYFGWLQSCSLIGLIKFFTAGRWRGQGGRKSTVVSPLIQRSIVAATLITDCLWHRRIQCVLPRGQSVGQVISRWVERDNRRIDGSVRLGTRVAVSWSSVSEVHQTHNHL